MQNRDNQPSKHHDDIRWQMFVDFVVFDALDSYNYATSEAGGKNTFDVCTWVAQLSQNFDFLA